MDEISPSNKVPLVQILVEYRDPFPYYSRYPDKYKNFENWLETLPVFCGYRNDPERPPDYKIISLGDHRYIISITHPTGEGKNPTALIETLRPFIYDNLINPNILF
jgi:hypothetical protein